MSWDGRQAAMLEAMGLGLWPVSTGAAPAALAEAPFAAATEPAPTTPPATAPTADSAAIAIGSASASSSIVLHAEHLDALHQSIQSCQRCPLGQSRRQAVAGVGHASAHWMVVGEAPGEQEDAQGEPFVGAAGKLLDAMLSAIGLSRGPGSAGQQVYLTNALKCRPPNNRNPHDEELRACAPFLSEQVRLVRPRIVLALGRFAAQRVLGVDAAIGALRGKVHKMADGTPVVVSYHPAYLLRQPLEKAKAWDDLCLAADTAQALESRA